MDKNSPPKVFRAHWEALDSVGKARLSGKTGIPVNVLTQIAHGWCGAGSTRIALLAKFTGLDLLTLINEFTAARVHRARTKPKRRATA